MCLKRRVFVVVEVGLPFYYEAYLLSNFRLFKSLPRFFNALLRLFELIRFDAYLQQIIEDSTLRFFNACHLLLLFRPCPSCPPLSWPASQRTILFSSFYDVYMLDANLSYFTCLFHLICRSYNNLIFRIFTCII